MALLAVLLLPACGREATGPAPRQIHIAGSSAAYPLSTAAAERLMRARPDVLAPLVRAGGSGNGIAAFCEAARPTRPDILVTTRAMTDAEAALCRRHASFYTAPVTIGRTAFLLVTAGGLPGLDRAELYRALAGPARRWSDIDPRLPAAPIRVHGPAPAPGIADGLYETLLDPGCRAAGLAGCATARPRSDGVYVGHGSDAELVARAVAADPGSLGILPYAQAVAHADTLKPVMLDGVAATPATIATARYPATAPLLLYVRRGTPGAPGLSMLLSYYAQPIQPGGA